MKYKFFGQKIKPACKYCSVGDLSSDEANVLCPKKGIMDLASSCRRFDYNPLKRVPKKAPVLPVYSMEEFTL